MTHPTRTELLRLREKKGSVAECVGILRARRQALIREFLQTVRPFLRSRASIAVCATHISVVVPTSMIRSTSRSPRTRLSGVRSNAE